MKLTKRDDVDFSGDVLIYDSAQESNPRFKHEATVSTGYTELTSISDWHTYGRRAITVYSDFRNELIGNFIPNWATLIDGEKKLLIEHYVYPSTETPSNLDLLYTQAERDQFMEDTVVLLNTCDCNLQKVISDGSYWNVLPNVNGNVQAAKFGTDVTMDAAIPTNTSFAEFYMTNNTTDTVIVTVDTMTKIAGTTIKGEASSDFTHANNKLTYTGTNTKKFKVTVTSTSVRATGTGNKLGRFAIFRNGVQETKTLSGNKDVGTPTETTFQGIIEMSTNDYVEMFVENKTDAEDFTIKNMMVITVEIKE